MKTYDVTMQGIVIKIIRVEAKDTNEATILAHKEYAEALYFINNADAMSGVIADDWAGDKPINPYLTYEVSQ